MNDESGTYDPAADEKTITMENVSLMPDWMGFSVLWAGALFLTCVGLLLFVAMPMFWIFPWKVALVPLLVIIGFDVVLAISAVLATLLTPSHETTWQYIQSRRAEWRGRETIRSDSTLPSRRDR